jgi:hypothetical protein
VVLAAGILVARSLLIGSVPVAAAPATASGFDIMVAYLRLGLRTLLVLGLVLALAGFLAGRSDTAVRMRQSVAGRLHRLRGPAADGPVVVWVRAHVRGLRIAAVAVAVLTFAFLTQPTGIVIIVIAAALMVVLALIEYLARPAIVAPVVADGDAPADADADADAPVDAPVDADADAVAVPAVADPEAPAPDGPSLPSSRPSSPPPNSP